jgi:hypothetical protein
MRLALCSLVLLTTIGLGEAVHAQSLTPGTRVRVVTPEGRQIGYVERASADSLVIANPGHSRTALAWSEVERTEYSLGKRGRPGRGALIGAGAMTLLTLASLGRDSDDLEGWGDVILIVALPMNAAVGAGLGALAGLAWRTERWAALPVGPGRVSHAAPSFGPGVTLTVRL